MRITKKTLQARVDYLNRLLDRSPTAYTKQENGKLKANIGHFYLSQAYGGYCLHEIFNEGGGVTCPINNYHTTAREMYEQLNAFIGGLSYGGEA